MHIKLILSNVSLTISPTFSFGPFKGLSSTQSDGKLGKFDFLNSEFIFESFSDGSKSMNLVSSDVLLHDIRSGGKKSIICTGQKLV